MSTIKTLLLKLRPPLTSLHSLPSLHSLLIYVCLVADISGEQSLIYAQPSQTPEDLEIRSPEDKAQTVRVTPHGDQDQDQGQDQGQDQSYRPQKRHRRAPTEFQAQTVEWSQDALTLSARGLVKLTQSGLTIRCESARVEFIEPTQSSLRSSSTRDEISALMPRELKRIHAHGDVTVTFRDLSLHATAVNYRHRDQILQVTGPISGRWGDMRLRGSSLQISLTTRSARARDLKLNVSLPAIVPKDGRDVKRWRTR